MDASARNELASIKGELNSIISELESISSGVRNDFIGIGNDSFDEFAAKYFQNYEDIITQYVQFLRTNIEQGYFDTETQNIGLADAFK